MKDHFELNLCLVLGLTIPGLEAGVEVEEAEGVDEEEVEQVTCWQSGIFLLSSIPSHI